MDKRIKDMMIIGFSLFSMFFGAGNVIFPPYLGMESGSLWYLGFISYFIADIGLALLSIFAMLKINKDVIGITEKSGKVLSTIITIAIVLCVGPLLAIPRTGATTFEMGIAPIFPEINSYIFSIIFFFIIWILCIKEGSVVDIIGKFLTPGLFIGLIILILKGIIMPIDSISLASKIPNVATEGVSSGYQTMDVLASLIFGIIILNTVTEKGYINLKDRKFIIGGASIIAAIGLLIVYGGLTYLGATVSKIYGVDIERSKLIISIVKILLGETGMIIFAIVVGLACVTTAVALVSSCSSYFSNLTKSKISYKVMLTIICVFSAIVSNVGLDTIISIAIPILNVVYPSALILIVLTLFKDKIKNNNVYKAGAIGALGISFLIQLSNSGLGFNFIKKLPLSEIGFGWVVPVFLCVLIGAFIPEKHMEKD